MPKASKPKSANAKLAPTAKRFEARLERLRSGLNWVIIHVPFDAAKAWGLRGQINVKGEINGFAFRTSLFPTREGRHILLVNKRMQKGAHTFEGSVAGFQLQLDTEKRIAAIPDELEQILCQGLPSEARALRRWYDQLNYSTRSDIAKWITEPKSNEARERRADQIAERLLAVMRRKGNCRRFCKSRSRVIVIQAPVMVGIVCRPRGGADTCLASTTTGLPMPKPAASRKCSMMPPRSPRKITTRENRRRIGARKPYNSIVLI